MTRLEYLVAHVALSFNCILAEQSSLYYCEEEKEGGTNSWIIIIWSLDMVTGDVCFTKVTIESMTAKTADFGFIVSERRTRKQR